jgi:SAM-dependent methyltransferase
MDVVISGQVLEHAEYFWITALEMARVLKPGGLICLIAPSAGPEHRYPVDCWRFYPDGMRAIAKFAHLDCLEVKTAWDNFGDHESDMWHDTVAVMRKPQRSWLKTRLITLVQSLQRDLMCWRLR